MIMGYGTGVGLWRQQDGGHLGFYLTLEIIKNGGN